MKKILLAIAFLFLLSGCNKEVEGETASSEEGSYSLVPDEIIPDDYENEVDWSILLREPDKYLLLKVQAMGDVIQVIEDYEEGFDLYLINEVRDGVGNTNHYFFAYAENDRLETRLLKNDRIRLFGDFAGDHTYQTVNGVNETVPLIYIHDVQVYFNE